MSRNTILSDMRPGYIGEIGNTACRRHEYNPIELGRTVSPGLGSHSDNMGRSKNFVNDDRAHAVPIKLQLESILSANDIQLSEENIPCTACSQAV